MSSILHFIISCNISHYLNFDCSSNFIAMGSEFVVDRLILHHIVLLI